MTTRILFITVALLALMPQAEGQQLALSNLEAVNVKMEEATHRGKKAIRLTGIDGQQEQLALIKGTEFKNGTIEAWVSGDRLAGTDSTFRGFIGMAFRVQRNDPGTYECFYIRPTNGRANDQLRRNHSTQYISHPDFPWFKLRKENPGVYESYADMVPAEWMKLKIVVKDTRARLYINDAEQPALIVNDLKRGVSNGAVALWIGVGTDGYFTNVKVTKED